MKRTILIALLLMSCGDTIHEIESVEPQRTEIEAVPSFEHEATPAPVALEVADPITPQTEAELVNVTIPIREIRRRYQGRMRVFRTFPIPPEAVTDDPVLTLSRMTASEEGWTSRDGMGAIIQIARNIRSRRCDPERHTDCVDGRESILSAFRRLSSRLTGQRNPRTRRGLWTSSLPAGDVEEPPPYWRQCPRGREGSRMRRDHLCEGMWSNYREYWNDRQAEAVGWIENRRGRGPCRGRPMAWGCRNCGDDVFMMRRNQIRVSRGFPPFELLECGDVRNRVWGIPPEPVSEESTQEV